jgi:hypothetical protein
MKLLFMFSFVFILYACSENTQNIPTNLSQENTEVSVDILSNVKDYEIQKSVKRAQLNLEYLQQKAHSFKAEFGHQYDAIPFATYINSKLYFYVSKGEWSNSNLRRDGSINKGGYKMGLVDEKNTTIIPIEYDKICNMGGLAYNLIEVEKEGKYGAFDIDGNELLKAEFDALYPADTKSDVWLQLKKDNVFGWLNKKGVYSFDPNSHPDKNLFSTPASTDLVKGWSFSSDNDLFHPVFDPFLEVLENEPSVGEGIIFSPSYLSNLGVLEEFQSGWMVFQSDWGLVNTKNSFRKIAQKVNGFSALWSVFESSFSDARDFDEHSNQLVIVSKDLKMLDNIELLETAEICGVTNSIRMIGDNLIEICQIMVNDYDYYEEMPVYNYYKVNENGKVNKLKNIGDFPMARNTLLTEEHMKGCFIRYISEAEMKSANLEEDGYNLVQTKHLSIQDLNIMRNEIFAVHGYIFSSPKYQKYFEAKKWYKPLSTNIEDKLSAIEKANIQFLKKMTKKMEGREQDFLKSSFIGYTATG